MSMSVELIFARSTSARKASRAAPAEAQRGAPGARRPAAGGAFLSRPDCGPPSLAWHEWPRPPRWVEALYHNQRRRAKLPGCQGRSLQCQEEFCRTLTSRRRICVSVTACHEGPMTQRGCPGSRRVLCQSPGCRPSGTARTTAPTRYLPATPRRGASPSRASGYSRG
jgi:hypothetical protein